RYGDAVVAGVAGALAVATEDQAAGEHGFILAGHEAVIVDGKATLVDLTVIHRPLVFGGDGQCGFVDGAAGVVDVADEVVGAAVAVVHRHAGDGHGLVVASVRVGEGEDAAAKGVAGEQGAGRHDGAAGGAGGAVVELADVGAGNSQRGRVDGQGAIDVVDVVVVRGEARYGDAVVAGVAGALAVATEDQAAGE